MDHADLRVVRLQPPELVVKALPHLRQVPGALVLSVLPDGAEVGLEDKFFPPAPQGPAQIGAELRIGGVQVDAVDPARLHGVHQLLHLRIGLVHKALTAHADLADQQACPSQLTIFHTVFLPQIGFFYCTAFPGNLQWAWGRETEVCSPHREK